MDFKISALLSLVATAALIFIVDIPWLYTVGPWASSMIQSIQKSPLEMRFAPAAVVYIALAFLLSLAKSVKEAFGIGLATYAVYDYTNLSTIKNYDAKFAAADSLWGGTLFAIAFTARPYLLRMLP